MYTMGVTNSDKNKIHQTNIFFLTIYKSFDVVTGFKPRAGVVTVHRLSSQWWRSPDFPDETGLVFSYVYADQGSDPCEVRTYVKKRRIPLW